MFYGLNEKTIVGYEPQAATASGNVLSSAIDSSGFGEMTVEIILGAVDINTTVCLLTRMRHIGRNVGDSNGGGL